MKADYPWATSRKCSMNQEVPDELSAYPDLYRGPSLPARGPSS
jgi:hypothetical protein